MLQSFLNYSLCSYPVTLLIVLLKSLDSPEFMSDPFCFHLFLSFPPRSTRKEYYSLVSFSFKSLKRVDVLLWTLLSTAVAFLMLYWDLFIYATYLCLCFLMYFGVFEKDNDPNVMVLSIMRQLM